MSHSPRRSTPFSSCLLQCTPGQSCGHYTPLVWANTRRVGCARHDCTALTYRSSVVCDYGPAGNSGGQPYVAGSAVNGACDLIFHPE